MANVSVAAEWQMLSNTYYRKLDIYQLQWNRIDLNRYKVACAPFGGPIAMIRDDSKIVQLYAESALRKLMIFNSAGVLMAETVWKHPGGRLVGLAWMDDQTLVCVVQDGTIFRYNVHAELLSPNISMGEECFEQNVVECVFWGNGMVCLTEANLVFCVPDFNNPEPCKLADPQLLEPPYCVAVIEPQHTMSGNVEVLLGVNDHLLMVDETGSQMVGVGDRTFQKMVVSRNISSPPEQLAWCGMDCVLLYWDDELLMIGPDEFPLRYLYDEPIILIPECDGVRVLSNTRMEFLHRVPDSTESIFTIGSTSPAAL